MQPEETLQDFEKRIRELIDIYQRFRDLESENDVL